MIISFLQQRILFILMGNWIHKNMCNIYYVKWMNTSWKELKDTLLGLYRRYYEYDKKYREYLESTKNLQNLEDYSHSFSSHRPTPYFVLQHIERLSEDGKGEQDKHILCYLLHIDSILDRIPIVHKMLSIIDANYDKKEEILNKSINTFCENKDNQELFKRMMLDYNNLIT